MTVADGSVEVVDAVEAAREAWIAFQSAVDELQGVMRRSSNPDVAFDVVRQDAYGAFRGRDEGMGVSLEAWLDSIEHMATGGGL